MSRVLTSRVTRGASVASRPIQGVDHGDHQRHAAQVDQGRQSAGREGVAVDSPGRGVHAAEGAAVPRPVRVAECKLAERLEDLAIGPKDGEVVEVLRGRIAHHDQQVALSSALGIHEVLTAGQPLHLPGSHVAPEEPRRLRVAEMAEDHGPAVGQPAGIPEVPVLALGPGQHLRLTALGRHQPQGHGPSRPRPPRRTRSRGRPETTVGGGP